MSTVNKQFLIGNLGKDPETIIFENGSLTKLSIATTEHYKDKSGNDISNTEWHNIVLNGKLSEITQKHLKKGDKVYVEGRTKHRSYQQDGITKYITEVHATNITFLTPKKDNVLQNSDDFPKDDLPFKKSRIY